MPKFNKPWPKFRKPMTDRAAKASLKRLESRIEDEKSEAIAVYLVGRTHREVADLLGLKVKEVKQLAKRQKDNN